jgi:hypothetical protein
MVRFRILIIFGTNINVGCGTRKMKPNTLTKKLSGFDNEHFKSPFFDKKHQNGTVEKRTKTQQKEKRGVKGGQMRNPNKNPVKPNKK